MIKQILGGLMAPLSNAYKANQERKMARDTAKAKIQMGRNDNEFKVEFTDQEWESISASKQGESWKDEYVTVSVVSLVNLIVLGGILTAFGYPQVLEGTTAAIAALTAAGVDVAFIINAVVLAALGLKVWRA